MKIKFLGTSHGVPMPGRYYQSFLIETEENAYLVDAGAPVMDILINEGYDLKKIKAVFITHMHSDHMNGLLNMIDLATWYYTDMNFEVYLPEQRGIDAIREYCKMPLFGQTTDRVSYHLVEEGVCFEDSVLKVTAVHTEHMATTTNIAFGFLLEAAGRKLYVTGDLSGSLREFPPAALNEAVDTLVVECAHFPAERLMEKLQDVIAKKVMIVHVFPVDKYDTLKEGIKDAAFEAIYPNDGEEYDI